MSDEIFNSLRNGFVAEIDPSLQDDVASAIVSRCNGLNFDIMYVFDKIGKQIAWLEVNGNEHPAHDDIFRTFVVNLCFIVKFFYPMMEQLDAAIDEKVEVIYEGKDRSHV